MELYNRPQAFIKKLDDYEIFRRSLKKPTTPKNDGNGKIVEKKINSRKRPNLHRKDRSLRVIGGTKVRQERETI